METIGHDPINCNADPESALEKMDPNPDPGRFFKIYWFFLNKAEFSIFWLFFFSLIFSLKFDEPFRNREFL